MNGQKIDEAAVAYCDPSEAARSCPIKHNDLKPRTWQRLNP